MVDEKLCISIILLFLYQSRGCWLFFGVISSSLFCRAMFVWTNIRHGRELTSLWATLSIKTRNSPPNLSPLQMTLKNTAYRLTWLKKIFFFVSAFCINFIVGIKIKSPWALGSHLISIFCVNVWPPWANLRLVGDLEFCTYTPFFPKIVIENY